MSNDAVDLHAGYNRDKLFWLSVVALVTAGMVFSMRGALLPDLQKTFFDPFHPDTAAGLVGKAAGAAFLGFAFSILFGSPLCDFLGMRRLLALSSILFMAGTLATILIPAGPNVLTGLWICMFTVGLGHGLVEAVINPLIATLFPDDKTHKLNVLHAWWPGGLILGSVLSTVLSHYGMDWKMQLGIIFVPAIIYLVLLIPAKFPPTERLAANISNGEMMSEAFKPLFILLFILMLGTAASELAPGQWVGLSLTRLVHFNAILLLSYVSFLMFIMRNFAGHLAHRLSPIGLMTFSCALASVGLFMLSRATGPVSAVVAATVWGVGVCYMWPTMLGITSERFPKGGALLMGLMGCSGNISIYFVLPRLGQIFDNTKAQAAIALGTTFDKLSSATDPASQAMLNDVQSKASVASFQAVAIVPAVLLFVFGAWWLVENARGGYKAERLVAPADVPGTPTEV